MANNLIETVGENPYASIVNDTTSQMDNLEKSIQDVLSAIAKLERLNPTSQYLPKLRDRLQELQQRMGILDRQNSAAKSLLNSYNDSLANANTMAGIYQLKQAELNRAQREADESYKKMYEDVKDGGQRYINALGNATRSENAIINANAGRYGASTQSTAEARARNYLANAQAQAEYNNNIMSQLNAIEENRLNSNAGYVQLSQSNADNTLRQQVMNDYESSQNASRYGYGSGSGGSGSRSPKVTLPDTSKNNPPTESSDGGTTNNNGGTTNNDQRHYKDFAASRYTAEQLRAGTYGVGVTDVVKYHGQPWALENGKMYNGLFGDSIANLDKDKVNAAVKKINDQYGEDFNTRSAEGYITDKGYVVLINTYDDVDGQPVEKQRAIPIEEVSDWNYYVDRDGNKRYFR